VGDEPFLLLLGDHIYVSDTKDRCARQLIRVYEQYMLDTVSGVQPTVERLLHLFGVIQGSPIDAGKGIYKADMIIEKPSVETAREKKEIQLTAAQEHLRQQTDKYWCVITQGQRYDTGIPYGLMETQLALSLTGIHRTEICEAIARILAMQVKS